MSEIFKALILGIVQGLSEFLPISSTGHLIVIPELLGWDGLVSSLSFDVALHLGTTLAVLAFFWRDWMRLVRAFITNLSSGPSQVFAEKDSRLFVLLILGSIPAGVLGFLIQEQVETSLRDPVYVALALIIFAFVLAWADTIKGNRQADKISIFDSIFIGVAQAISLFPGVSRSGATITAGLLRGLSREEATRFSFLLSTPIVVGAAAFKFKELFVEGGFQGGADLFLVGGVAAAVSGWFAIKWLLKFVQTNSFKPFVIYRIVLGVAILLATFLR